MVSAFSNQLSTIKEQAAKKYISQERYDNLGKDIHMPWHALLTNIRIVQGSNARKGEGKEKRTISKVDGISYTGDGGTIGKAEKPEKRQINMEKTYLLVTENWHQLIGT